MKVIGLLAGAVLARMAARHYEAKTGFFAAELQEDALRERKKYDRGLSRVADDLRHSNWPAVLRALPEDPAV